MAENKNENAIDINIDLLALDSFNFQQKSSNLFVSKVNIVLKSLHFNDQKFTVNENGGYFVTSLLIRPFEDLSEDSSSSFPLLLCLSEENGKENVSFLVKMLEIEQSIPNEPNLTIRLVLKKKEIMVKGPELVLQFRHEYEYRTMLRILDFKEKSKNLTPDGNNISLQSFDEEENAIELENNTINNYDKEVRSRARSRKTKIKGLFDLARLNLRKKKRKDISPQRDYRMWKVKDIELWFQQIPVFQENKKRMDLCSLYDYLKHVDLFDVIFEELTRRRENLDQFGKLVGIVEYLRNKRKEEIRKNEGKRRKKLKKEGKAATKKWKLKIKEEEEEEEGEEMEESITPKFAANPLIDRIYEDKILVSRLLRHFDLLGSTKLYNPSYYAVLKKDLKRRFRSKKVVFSRTVLENREEEIFFEESFHWDVSELRNKLLFNILYSQSLNSYLHELNERLNDIQSTRKENREFRSKEESYEILRKETGGIVICNLDFNLFVERKRNEILKLRKRILGEDRRLKFLENQMRNMDGKKSESKLVDEYKKLKEDEPFRKIEEEKCKKEFGEIINPRSSMIKKMKRKFYSNENLRKFEIRRLIEDKLNLIFGKREARNQEEKNEEKNDFKNLSLTSKLVVSKKLKKGELFSKFGKLGRFFVDERSFRYGLTHAYVIICNLAFHWRDNELVLIESICNTKNQKKKKKKRKKEYRRFKKIIKQQKPEIKEDSEEEDSEDSEEEEEILSMGYRKGDNKFERRYMTHFDNLACVDCQSQIFCSANELIEYVSEIAKLVIHWNTNIQYKLANIAGEVSMFKKNCHEFSDTLLRKLQVPYPFYEPVQRYIKNLKHLSYQVVEGEEEIEYEQDKKKKKGRKKKKGKKEKIFRYLEVWDNEVLNLILDGKKVEKIPFRSHKELDEFIELCYGHCKKHDLEKEHPDLYQILKAFDRAFWITKLYDVEYGKDKVNQPWVRRINNGKPIIECRFYEEYQKNKDMEKQ